MIYSVNYDLKKPGQSYKELHEAIKECGVSWWHYLDSTWLIDTNLSANQIWQRLEPYFDKNDVALVIRVTNDYQGWLPEKAWQWIRERFRRAA